MATPEQVRDIIEFGHVHVAQARDFPKRWMTGFVVTPDMATHHIQIIWTDPDNYTCHCWNCKETCPAAIAAFVIFFEQILPELQAGQRHCPVCGEVLGDEHD